MSKIQYIGRKSKLCGKTGFEILSNLKNFGIGRMLGMSEWEKFPEPSYYIVKDVEPRMDEALSFGRIWVEKVYRGLRHPNIVEVKNVYHPDFRLIPKDQEQEYLKGYKIRDFDPSKMTVLPRYYSVPPLMREFLIRTKKEKGENINENDDFKIQYHYHGIENSLYYRIAEENEKPNIEFSPKPKIHPRFLEGIKEIKD